MLRAPAQDPVWGGYLVCPGKWRKSLKSHTVSLKIEQSLLLIGHQTHPSPWGQIYFLHLKPLQIHSPWPKDSTPSSSCPAGGLRHYLITIFSGQCSWVNWFCFPNMENILQRLCFGCATSSRPRGLTLIVLVRSSDHPVCVRLRGADDTLDAWCSHRVLFLLTACQGNLAPHTPILPFCWTLPLRSWGLS